MSDAFTIKVEPVFERDYKRTVRKYPQIKDEFKAALLELRQNGNLPEAYGAHTLDNPGGNYNNAIDFHLSEGKVDVVVIYVPHKSNPIIRLVRMGTHEELFSGPLL